MKKQIRTKDIKPFVKLEIVKPTTTVSTTFPGFHFNQKIGNGEVWILFDNKPQAPVYIEL